jgi:hypothetical protein
MPGGRSLELYFIDGHPEGMLTAEVFNWTGHVLKFPRTQLRDALKRKEAAQTGVYLLLSDDSLNPIAYIGESENVAARMRDHEARKDWWTEAFIITTAADNLHKAHVKYLEARLIEVAKAVGAVPLDNNTTPPRPGLTEAAQANMEEFLSNLFIVLPALRVSIFSSGKRPAISEAGPRRERSARFRLQTPRHNVDAMAVLQGSDFVIEKGSRVRGAWVGSEAHAATYQKLHADLVATGVIDTSVSPAVFAENYAFSSPSAAAAM